MDSKSTNAEGTWFVTASLQGKLICCAKESKANVLARYVANSVVECTEVFELTDPIQASETAPGQISVGKQALATPFGVLSEMRSMHVGFAGGVVVFFDDMSELDQRFHLELLKNARGLMAGWKTQREAAYSAIKLASAGDLLHLGHPRRS